MKWQLPQKARVGQLRFIEKFAWLPMRCVGNYDDFGNWTEYRVWLEHYTETQEYQRVMVEHHGHGFYEEQWVTTGKTTIPKDKRK